MRHLYQVLDTSPSKKADDECRLYNSVLSAFRALSNNGHVATPGETGYVHDLDVYLTFDSLRAHLPRVIAHCNDSVALRLYNVLSMGRMMKRIYLPQFMVIVHPLIFGNWIEKNYFAFRMLDGDNDGIISAVDLSDLIQSVLEKCPSTGFGENLTKKCTCIMYEEVMKLYDMNLYENILVENQKLRKHIDFATFLQDTGITMSCLVIQLQNLLLHQYVSEIEGDRLRFERDERRRRLLLTAQQAKNTSSKGYDDDFDSSSSQRHHKRKLGKRESNGDFSDDDDRSDASGSCSPRSHL